MPKVGYIIICSWCLEYLRGHGDSEDGVSHGICFPCAVKLIEEAKALIDQEGQYTEEGQ